MKGKRLLYVTGGSYAVAILCGCVSDFIGGHHLLLQVPMFVAAGIAGTGVGLLVFSGIEREFRR